MEYAKWKIENGVHFPFSIYNFPLESVRSGSPHPPLPEGEEQR
jgi:hypothetical protein